MSGMSESVFVQTRNKLIIFYIWRRQNKKIRAQKSQNKSKDLVTLVFWEMFNHLGKKMSKKWFQKKTKSLLKKEKITSQKTTKSEIHLSGFVGKTIFSQRGVILFLWGRIFRWFKILGSPSTEVILHAEKFSAINAERVPETKIKLLIQ